MCSAGRPVMILGRKSRECDACARTEQLRRADAALARRLARQRGELLVDLESASEPPVSTLCGCTLQRGVIELFDARLSASLVGTSGPAAVALLLALARLPLSSSCFFQLAAENARALTHEDIARILAV